MNNNLSIIGAGAWGSALSIALADNFDTVYLHTHTQKEVTVLQPRHPALSIDYAPNIKLTFDKTAYMSVIDEYLWHSASTSFFHQVIPIITVFDILFFEGNATTL
jgi:glycerol-3-phosphate dehydrogenase